MATAAWFVVATLTWFKRDVATIARLPVEAHTWTWLDLATASSLGGQALISRSSVTTVTSMMPVDATLSGPFR